MKKLTERTETDPTRLLEILARVAEDGYAIVDQELDLGLRSVAVPIMQDGTTIAAINIGMQSARVPMADVHRRLLPALRKVAQQLGQFGRNAA